MKHRSILVRALAILLVILMLPLQALATAAPAPQLEIEAVTMELLNELSVAEAAIEEAEVPEAPLTEGIAPQSGSVPAHVGVQAGDVRIENDSLRIDIGRLGQITRLNIVDMDLNRLTPATNPWREMNFVASDHTFASNFRNSALHQWMGEMIFSVRSADTPAGLAGQPFVEMDTNRTMQAGGRATHSNPGGDPNVNPFFQRTLHETDGRIHVQFNPDANNLPLGTETNPSGGDLNGTWMPGAPNRTRIIRDFQIDSIFDSDTEDGSILWTITITNPDDSGQYLEFGDIGLPMLWNSRFSRATTGGTMPTTNTQHVYDNAVVAHTFQGADSGFIKAIPVRGDNFIVFAPVPETGARIEYIDHWTGGNLTWGVANTHRPQSIWSNDSGSGVAGDANNYNLHGMQVAYIHSMNIRNFTGTSYFHDTTSGYDTYFADSARFPGGFNPLANGHGSPSDPAAEPLFTSLVLAPGEEQTYQFTFHAVRGGDNTPEDARGGRNSRMTQTELFDENDDPINQMMEREMNMRTILYNQGLIDAVAFPGFQPAINMPTMIALRHDPAQTEINDVVVYCIHENDPFDENHIPAWGTQAGRNRSRVVNTTAGRGAHGAGAPGVTAGATLREDLSGYDARGEWVSVYELDFSCIGHNTVRVYYDLLDGGDVVRGAFTQFHFNVLAELDELTSAHADFLRETTQFSTENYFEFKRNIVFAHLTTTQRLALTDAEVQAGIDAWIEERGEEDLINRIQSDPLYGIYFDWNLSAESPFRITNHLTGVNNRIFDAQPAANGTIPAVWRWGDDWSHGHGMFMAMANYMDPSYDNIRSLETFLIDFMWDRYMAHRHDSLYVNNWLHNTPIHGQWTGAGDTSRFFATQMVAWSFFNMYRLQRAFPELMEFRHDALWYLDRAAGIWETFRTAGWANTSTGYYGEQLIEPLMQALHEEGRTERLATFRQLYGNLAGSGTGSPLNAAWAFGSEFEYDNTTEEGLYARIIAMRRHFPNHTALHQASQTGGTGVGGLRAMRTFEWSTRAKRGWNPAWYQHGVPVFRGGESWWNFQYTTSLAGHIMDDWLRMRYDIHQWDDDSIAWANRVNYAASLGNFNHVNMGQISDRSIGGASNTYSLRKGTFGSQAVQVSVTPVMLNGWDDFSLEAPLSLSGSLFSVSTDVVDDPLFGMVAYGGDLVSYDADNIAVRPLDGFGRRVHFLNDRVYITLDNNAITEARLTRDGSRVELDVRNESGAEHMARIDTYGLTPGFYSITVDGVPSGQFYVNATHRNENGTTGLGLQAREGRALAVIPDGEDFTVVFTRLADGDAIEPSVRFVQQFANPRALEQLPLLAQVIHDGFHTYDVQWSVVSAPQGAEVEFYSETPILATGRTLTRFNMVDWVDRDTSQLRRALVTPSLPGVYVLRATITYGPYTVYEEITITVGEAMEVEPPVILELEYTQEANMVMLEAFAQTYDRANRDMEFEWELISWPSGGQDAAIIVPENPTEMINLGVGAGFNARTVATLAVPRSGTFTIRLSVTDMGQTTVRYFEVAAHGDFSIRAYNVVTGAGDLPTLPATVRVPVGGEMEDVAINWGTLNPAQFTVPGAQVELTGSAMLDDGSVISITTTVFVVRDVTARENHAFAGTLAASFTNSDQGGITTVQRPTPPDGTSANYGPSSNPARGAWHTWGQEGSSQTLQYTWTTAHLIDRFDMFIMRPANNNFHPIIDDILVQRTPGGPWISVENIQGEQRSSDGAFVPLAHVWNTYTFEPQFIYGLRLALSPGGNGGIGIGIMRWWPQGYAAEIIAPPVPLYTHDLQILRDAAFEMNGGNRESGGSPGTTARFANLG